MVSLDVGRLSRLGVVGLDSCVESLPALGCRRRAFVRELRGPCSLCFTDQPRLFQG